MNNKKSNFLLKFEIVSFFLILIFINITIELNGNKNKISITSLNKNAQNTSKNFKIIAISYSNK